MVLCDVNAFLTGSKPHGAEIRTSCPQESAFSEYMGRSFLTSALLDIATHLLKVSGLFSNEES